MVDFRFPRIPYDEVRSEFIREEIRRGDFDDIEYRRYVNKLIWIEWFTTEGLSPNATGISGFGAGIRRWRLAAEYPEEYDIIRREFGATTRKDHRHDRRGGADRELSDEEREERRERAREYAGAWHRVQESDASW